MVMNCLAHKAVTAEFHTWVTDLLCNGDLSNTFQHAYLRLYVA